MKKVLVLCVVLFLFVMFEGTTAFADEEARLSGTDRFKTAVEISKAGWDSADTIVLSTAFNFPDALAGGPLAHQMDAPILLTRKDRLVDATRDEILRLGATKAVILGGDGVVSQDVVKKLKTIGLSVERVSGTDRYETAAEIAKKLEATDTAFVVYGRNFPDALSIAPYAAKEGHPILLTRTAKIPDATKEFLKKVDNVVVVGGPGVVSDKIMKQMPNATRVSGKNRFQTAAKFVQKYQMDANNTYIATGYNFADALTGSVLAAKNNGAMLLVRPTNLPSEIHYVLNQKQFTEAIPLGGPNAVSEEVVKKVDDLLKNDTIGTATPIQVGHEYTGRINYGGDKDYYKFTLTEPGKLQVLMNEIPDKSWEVSVLNQNEDQYLTFDTDRSSTASSYSEKDIGLTAGTYYVKVKTNWSTNDVQYRFQIEFSKGDYEKEFNNTLRDANRIEVGPEYKGHLQTSSDDDFYKFELDQAGNLILDVNQVVGASWKYILLNEDGEEYLGLITSRGNDASARNKRKVGLPAGVYYLKVDYHHSSRYKEYNFNLSFKAGNHYEQEHNNNRSEANHIEMNKQYQGALQWSNEEDYYTFTVNQPSTITIEMKNKIGSSWDFELKDENGSRLGRKTTSRSGNASDTTTMTLELSPGDHFLNINNGYSGAYDDYFFTVHKD